MIKDYHDIILLSGVLGVGIPVIAFGAYVLGLAAWAGFNEWRKK